MAELSEQVRRVAELRARVQVPKAILAEARAEFDRQNLDLTQEIQALTEEMTSAENGLRSAAVALYVQDGQGNKQMVPGVGIREMTRIVYDRDQAFAWALEHRVALSLDIKAFERVAKATPLPFVSTEVEVTATIATDLSKMLEAAIS